MNIENFLKETGQSITAFANQHNIPATTVWRAVKGMVLRPYSAKKISDASGKIVTTDELLYPEKYDNEKGDSNKA